MGDLDFFSTLIKNFSQNSLLCYKLAIGGRFNENVT